MKLKIKKYYFDVYGNGYTFDNGRGMLFECESKSLKSANKKFKKYLKEMLKLKNN